MYGVLDRKRKCFYDPEYPPPSPTEVILCDQLGPQTQNLNITQPSQDPLQTQALEEAGEGENDSSGLEILYVPLEDNMVDANNQKTTQKTNILSVLEKIAERLKEQQHLQSLQRAAQRETRPFSSPVPAGERVWARIKPSKTTSGLDSEEEDKRLDRNRREMQHKVGI